MHELCELTRTTAAIGVEVAGLDLGRALDADDVEFLQGLLDRHHVVFVRGQQLDAAQHIALAEAFGRIEPSPVQQLTGSSAKLSTIEDSADRPPAEFVWHTDLSWSTRPPRLGFLHALTIPPYGGDTLWASTAAMFDLLDADEQRRCAALSVLHAPDPTLIASVRRHHGDEIADRLRSLHPAIEQPLVRRNERTGRYALFLSPLYQRGVAHPGPGDDELLARLDRMLDDPRVQVRWRWREGDVAIWDEASTCHRALGDHFPQRRVVRRCVV